MTEQSFLAVISGKNQSASAAVWRGVLSCMSPFYAFGAWAKNKAFDAGISTVHDLGRPTISIGNLTTGGTGKTPMVAWVVKQLVAQGHKPCVLLRGYKSKNGVSDEALELKSMVGESAYVAPNPNRVEEAKKQLTAHPEITCFVLDDGFQHRRAKRDLDLVLIDATNPWGYGNTLPRGLMRECAFGLMRASGVIITRADRVEMQTLAQIAREIQAITGRVPLALAQHGWEAGNEELKGKRIALACGIGNPEAFVAQAKSVAEVVMTQVEADHFAWDEATLTKLFADAQKHGAQVVLTTEKDFVKWQPLLGRINPTLPIIRPRLAMQLTQGQDALITLLTSKIPLVKQP